MCSSYPLETKRYLNKSDLKPLLCIYPCHVWEIESSFSDLWFIFCWQSPEMLNHMWEQRCWIRFVIWLYIGWAWLHYLHICHDKFHFRWLLPPLPSLYMRQFFTHTQKKKWKKKNFPSHTYEDSFEVNSTVLRHFESLIADPDGTSGSLGEVDRSRVKEFGNENEMYLAWLSDLALQAAHSLSD